MTISHVVAYSASRSTKLTKVTFDLNCIMLVSFMSRQIDLYACFVVAFITFETFCLQMLSFNMVFHVRNAIVCVIALAAGVFYIFMDSFIVIPQ